MRLTAYIEQHSRANALPLISIREILSEWDWRIVRLLSVFSFVAAAWTQYEWAQHANVQALSFYYSVASAACVVCAGAYFWMCAYSSERWSITEHFHRVVVQFLSCILWMWTMLLDAWAQHINGIVTDWSHHWEINWIVVIFLSGACVNEIFALARAMAYEGLAMKAEEGNE